MGEEIDKVFGEPQFFYSKVGDNEFTQPIVFGECGKPEIEGDGSGIPFKKTWSGEPSATFIISTKVRQVKGNRRQRKTAAFANKKTVFGLMERFTARSPKADKRRARIYAKQYKHSQRNYKNGVLMREAQLRRLKGQDVPLIWQHWGKVTEYMKKHKSDHEEA